MFKGYATKEGTKKFAEKFENSSDDFYNKCENLIVSSVGVGSFAPEAYREENYIYSFKDSIKEAIKLGCNFIDTAINYRYQESEREIGAAISELIDENVITREEIVVSSKGGFIPLDFPFPENPYKWIEEHMIGKKLAKKEEIELDQHCISPKFVEWSLEQSRKNLGLETIDIYYLHNPEMQLGNMRYKKLLETIEDNFEMFEKKVKEGAIKHYGIASWNGLLYEDTNIEYLSLLDIYKIAKKVGGKNNHFKFVQIPYNLAKPHAYSYTNQKLEDELFYSLFQATKKLGINVVTSSAFLRMNLFKRPFSQKVRGLLGEEAMSDLHRALQFSRSNEFVTSALFSTKDIEHMRHDMEIITIKKAKPEYYSQIFKI